MDIFKGEAINTTWGNQKKMLTIIVQLFFVLITLKNDEIDWYNNNFTNFRLVGASSLLSYYLAVLVVLHM